MKNNLYSLTKKLGTTNEQLMSLKQAKNIPTAISSLK